jgi:hypothetical protein
MMRIALLIPEIGRGAHDYFLPYLTPGGDDVWNGAQFVVNPNDGEFDGVVAFQSVQALDRTFRLTCPPSRTMLFLQEPPDILFLPDGYTRQFYTTLGQDSRVRCRRPALQAGQHHWFVELPFATANGTPTNAKPKLLSAVVSAKADTAGHRNRLRFMETLKEYFQERLDWFGRGVQDLGDRKLSGLADYRYHIVLENGSWPHYWTEKIADAFVANCFPFYWGAPNIGEYFDANSFESIDLMDRAGAIAKIEAAIADDRWTKSQSALAAAREKVLFGYHPYQTCLDFFASAPRTPAREIVIRPHSEFTYSVGGRIRHRLWKMKYRAMLHSAAA